MVLTFVWDSRVNRNLFSSGCTGRVSLTASPAQRKSGDGKTDSDVLLASDATDHSDSAFRKWIFRWQNQSPLKRLFRNNLRNTIITRKRLHYLYYPKISSRTCKYFNDVCLFFVFFRRSRPDFDVSRHLASWPARRHFVQTPFVAAPRNPVDHREDAARWLPGLHRVGNSQRHQARQGIDWSTLFFVSNIFESYIIIWSQGLLRKITYLTLSKAPNQTRILLSYTPIRIKL